MITIISGTNRPENNTRQVVHAVAEKYRESGMDTQIYDLIDLPRDVAFSEVFGERSDAFAADIKKYVEGVDKFIFVLPEYNGSFPGILKLFIDAVEPHYWHGKKAAVVGLATGRSGNLRGLDHLTNILNYLRIDVMHFKPNLSHLPGARSGGLEIPPQYHSLLEMQCELFRKF